MSKSSIKKKKEAAQSNVLPQQVAELTEKIILKYIENFIELEDFRQINAGKPLITLLSSDPKSALINFTIKKLNQLFKQQIPSAKVCVFQFIRELMQIGHPNVTELIEKHYLIQMFQIAQYRSHSKSITRGSTYFLKDIKIGQNDDKMHEIARISNTFFKMVVESLYVWGKLYFPSSNFGKMYEKLQREITFPKFPEEFRYFSEARVTAFKIKWEEEGYQLNEKMPRPKSVEKIQKIQYPQPQPQPTQRKRTRNNSKSNNQFQNQLKSPRKQPNSPNKQPDSPMKKIPSSPNKEKTQISKGKPIEDSKQEKPAEKGIKDNQIQAKEQPHTIKPKVEVKIQKIQKIQNLKKPKPSKVSKLTKDHKNLSTKIVGEGMNYSIADYTEYVSKLEQISSPVMDKKKQKRDNEKQQSKKKISIKTVKSVQQKQSKKLPQGKQDRKESQTINLQKINKAQYHKTSINESAEAQKTDFDRLYGSKHKKNRQVSENIEPQPTKLDRIPQSSENQSNTILAPQRLPPTMQQSHSQPNDTNIKVNTLKRNRQRRNKPALALASNNINIGTMRAAGRQQQLKCTPQLNYSYMVDSTVNQKQQSEIQKFLSKAEESLSSNMKNLKQETEQLHERQKVVQALNKTEVEPNFEQTPNMAIKTHKFETGSIRMPAKRTAQFFHEPDELPQSSRTSFRNQVRSISNSKLSGRKKSIESMALETLPKNTMLYQFIRRKSIAC